jgi:hypothetical protein
VPPWTERPLFSTVYKFFQVILKPLPFPFLKILMEKGGNKWRPSEGGGNGSRGAQLFCLQFPLLFFTVWVSQKWQHSRVLKNRRKGASTMKHTVKIQQGEMLPLASENRND